jgi:PPE-repeat protein
MDFGDLPLEINSERTYSGPGLGSILAAAWDGLACRLVDVAASYRSVTGRLVDGWQRPTAIAMIRAGEPCFSWVNAYFGWISAYFGWMNTTAVTPVGPRPLRNFAYSALVVRSVRLR